MGTMQLESTACKLHVEAGSGAQAVVGHHGGGVAAMTVRSLASEVVLRRGRWKM